MHVRIGDRILTADLLQLRVVLQEHDRAVEQNNDQEVNVDADLEILDGLLVVWIELLLGENHVDGETGVPDHGENVQREEEEKEEEVLVVLVAQTVVDECAVVVEALHALVAVIAMHSVLRPQVLAVDADVVEVQLFVDESLHQAQEVLLERHVPRVDQCKAVEDDGEGKEDRVHQDRDFLLLLTRIACETNPLIVARSDHKERHVDYVKEKHDDLRCSRPFNLFDRPSQSEAFAAFRERQNVLHLLHVTRFEHARVLLEQVQRRQSIFVNCESVGARKQELLANLFELLKRVLVEPLLGVVFVLKLILVFASLVENVLVIYLLRHKLDAQVKTRVAVTVSTVDICAELDQSLHVFNVHRNGGEVQGCGTLVVLVSHPNRVQEGEDENREHALVPLRRAVHHSLVMVGFLVRVPLELEHEHFDHVSVAGCCSQVNRL